MWSPTCPIGSSDTLTIRGAVHDEHAQIRSEVLALGAARAAGRAPVRRSAQQARSAGAGRRRGHGRQRRRSRSQQVDEQALEQPAGELRQPEAVAGASTRRAAPPPTSSSATCCSTRKPSAAASTATALSSRRSPSKVTPVTEADVTAWYQANPQRVQGATLDQVRAPIQSTADAGAHRRPRATPTSTR